MALKLHNFVCNEAAKTQPPNDHGTEISTYPAAASTPAATKRTTAADTVNTPKDDQAPNLAAATEAKATYNVAIDTYAAEMHSWSDLVYDALLSPRLSWSACPDMAFGL